MTWRTALPFLVGWSCGWVLLARCPRLAGRRAAIDPRRAPVAVIIPARNEAGNLGAAIDAVRAQLRGGDQLLVVDDHSTDATADVARAAGADVLAAPELPGDWSGKCWACHQGAWATSAPTLVFVDADVELAEGALRDLAAAVAVRGGLISVQPWHRPRRLYEQLSMPFNLVALMGSAVCVPWGRRVRPRVAFGPVLATSRADYDDVGGHAHRDVRGSVVDDIALAQRYDGRVTIATGRTTATFRMYPDGVRSLAQGWSKNIAAGASNVPWWAFVGVVAWLWSVIGAPGAGWPCWLASAAQVWILGRRVGRWHLLTAVIAPLLAVFFLCVLAWSALLRAFRWPVQWRGRDVLAR